MIKLISYIVFISIFIIFTSNSYSDNQTGKQIKFISSCELDLNNDGKLDIVFLIESSKDIELIVLMQHNDKYNAYVISRGKKDMLLSCHYSLFIKETSAGKGKKEGKVYKTPGYYIKLTKPEGASVVYFWDGKGFKEVWTTD